MITTPLQQIIQDVLRTLSGRTNCSATRPAIEALEERQLLAYAQITGTEADDTFYLRRSSSYDTIQVFLGNAPSGTPAYTFPVADTERVYLNTLGGDDTVIVDLLYGNPIPKKTTADPARGMYLDCGESAAGGDSVIIKGNDSDGEYSPGTTAGGGVLEVDMGPINFSGLERASVDRLTWMSYVTPLGDDAISIESPAAGIARFTGTSGGVTMMPIDFQRMRNLEIDLATHDGGAGNDQFSIGAGGIPFAELQGVYLNLGGGLNTASIAGGAMSLVPSLYEDGSLALTTSGTAQVTVNQSLDLTSLSVQGTSKLTLGTGSLRTLRVDNFQMAATARLDLGNSDMIIRTPAGQAQAVLGELMPLLISGCANGAWDGPGIGSSAAKADATRLTGLGILANDAGGGAAVRTSFAGLGVEADSVLIKYTLAGDLDLNGRVDIDDYYRIDTGYARARQGYASGDANFSGGIGPDDYFILDRTFVSGRAPLSRGEMTRDGLGRTVITPAPDSRIIYVSSSQGNDANSGLSAASPVKTLARGQSLLRDNMPDWLLLKRGDTWTDERLANWRIGGRTEHEVMLVGAYGTGTQRPIVQYGGGQEAFSARASAGEISHMAIMGIEFKGTSETPGTGLRRTCPGSNFLVEDCVFRQFNTGLSIEGYDRLIGNITIRRTQILDNFKPTGGSYSQGIYFENADGVLLEENLIDHNGWRNADRSDATQQNHNIYMHSTVRNAVVRKNIIANAASHGVQARGGGTIEDNVFVGNPISLSLGLVNGALLWAGGVTGRVTGNLFLESTDISATSTRGWALEVSNIKPGSGSIISDNIFAHDRSVGSYAAIEFMDPTKSTNPSAGVGLRDLRIEGNIVYDWESAVNFDPKLVPGASGVTGYSGLAFNDNFFWTLPPSNPNNPQYILKHDAAIVPAYETWSGNTYYSEKDILRWFRLQGQALSFDQWFTAIEPTAHAGHPDFVDPSRSVSTYAAALGLGSTSNDFLQAARLQSSLAWNPLYATDAVLEYVRDGFAFSNTVMPLPNGLTATYFDNADFTGAEVYRTDPDANQWFNQSPAGGIGIDHYAVQWEGLLAPTASDAYTLYLTGNDGARLWLDGKLLLDTWGFESTFEEQVTLSLSAAQRYRLGLEVFNGTGDGGARLEWSSSSMSRQPIPATALHTKPPPAPGVRLLILGDAVTQGTAGDATWRYWLDKHLRYGGYQFDFLGSMQGVAGGAPAYGNFDPDHDALSGRRVDQLLQQLPAHAAEADLILLHLGTEDLLQGQSPASIAAAIGELIAQLRQANPTATILLARIAPAAGVDTQALNALLDALPDVVRVDQHTGFDPQVDTRDGLHLSRTGEQKMARRWFAAIESALSPAGVPAAPQQLVALARSGNRVELRWLDTSHNESDLLVQRRIAGTGVFQTLATIEANSTGYQDNSAAPQTAYEYRVVAQNLAGQSPSAPVAASTTNLTFHRAINLGGTPLTIDGYAWDGSASGNYSYIGNPAAPASYEDLIPLASPQMSVMLRDAIAKGSGGTNLIVGAVPQGQYVISLYTCVYDRQSVASLTIEGQLVQPIFDTGPVGSWTRHGPYVVNVNDGDIRVQFSEGSMGNIYLAGIEIWKVVGG